MISLLAWVLKKRHNQFLEICVRVISRQLPLPKVYVYNGSSNSGVFIVTSVCMNTYNSVTRSARHIKFCDNAYATFKFVLVSSHAHSSL